MEESKRSVVMFLEKEIETYTALSLFLSKKGIQKHLHAGGARAVISPSYYKERIKEARKLIHDLRKSS